MITLIATGHKDNGLCNSNELYKIIEQINPDIIFEELCPDGFAAIYTGSRIDTLETSTIKLYLQKHPIDHLPVDLDGNKLVDLQLKTEILQLFDIFNHSLEYRYLSSQLNFLSEQNGFSYLNSNHFSELMARKRLLEEHLLRKINNEKLLKTYNDWLNIHDIRENEMINNIYSYCKSNKFNRALFIIGAEHRQPMKEKIPTYEKNSNLKINWTFDFFK